MAQRYPTSPPGGSGEVFIADCKGNVYVFNNEIKQWSTVGEGQLCRVMLYQYGGQTFRLVTREETSEAKVVLNLTLQPFMMYEMVSEQWHQLKTDSVIYGFRFLVESNPRNFAVVMLSLLKAVQATNPPLPPPPSASYGTYPMPRPSPSMGNRSYAAYRENYQRSDMFMGSPSQTQDHRENTEDILSTLSSAIAQGDRKKSVEIVEKLTAEKAHIILTEAKRGIRKPKDLHKHLSLSVQAEDKDCSGACFKLQATPATTVGDLKLMVFKKYNLPCEVQKWIIGKKITKNEDTLVKLGITTSGAAVFLYLMSAKDVGFKHTPYVTDIDLKTSTFPSRTSVSSSDSLHSSNTGLPNMQNTANSELFSTSQPLQNIAQNAQTQGSVSASNTFVNINSNQNGPNLLSPNQDMSRGRIEPVISEDIQPIEVEVKTQGWTCPSCTFINPPTRPGCGMCSADRPENYIMPQDLVLDEDEKMRLQQEQILEMMYKQAEEQTKIDAQNQAVRNYEEYLEMAQQTLIPNPEEFDCTICYTPVEVGEGVVLRDCLHSFCRDCLVETIRNSEEAEVQCPYQDEVVTCHTVITGQEVKALLSPEDFDKFLRRSLSTAESQAANSFHCKSANCPGWCLYEDNVNTFLCPVCEQPNCLTCKVIHPEMNCREYQDDLKRRADNDDAAKQTQLFLEEMIEKGDAMNCPQCKIVLLKKDGCDWMRCSMCKLEICWATRGPRWGPQGNGDISGGCRCRVGGTKCVAKCRNCH